MWVEKFFMTKISGTLAKGKEILGHQNTISSLDFEATFFVLLLLFHKLFLNKYVSLII